MNTVGPFLLLILLLAAVVCTVFLRTARFRRVILFDYQRGALFRNGVFQAVLGPGRYWTSAARQIQVVDTRLQALSVAGQEVLTADGLSLKITLAGEYRIVDPARYLLTSTAPGVSLYQDAQQSLREAVAGLSFDDLLQTRKAVNEHMKHSLAAASRLGLEVTSIEVRDIILPGELKKAYAQAVTAQKEGLAALERARGEAASLRSLANAARLMQEHPGLLQLRAVQAIETTKGSTLTLELPIQHPRPNT